MGAGPAYVDLRSQYISLLQRKSFTQTSVVSVPANAVASEQVSTGVQIPIPMGQAIRNAMLYANVADTGNTGKLTVVSFAIRRVNPSVFTYNAYPSPRPATLIGSGGTTIGVWDDNELLVWNDYLEVGGLQNLTYKIDIDISNSDGAAAHNVTMLETYLIEFYQLNPMGVIVT
jgi:hypothetical protein